MQRVHSVEPPAAIDSQENILSMCCNGATPVTSTLSGMLTSCVEQHIVQTTECMCLDPAASARLHTQITKERNYKMSLYYCQNSSLELLYFDIKVSLVLTCSLTNYSILSTVYSVFTGNYSIEMYLDIGN